MPIFMQYEGIRGNVTNKGNGGVWKTTNFLAGGTKNNKGGSGALVNLGGSNTWGGIYIAAGDLDSNVIEVSSISLPKTPAYSIVIDGRDANAVVKTRMLFDAHRNGGTFILTFKGQVTGAANHIQSMNNLRQIAMSGRKVTLIEIFVSNGGNSNGLSIELENCLVSSWSNGAHSSAGGLPAESLSVNFTKITYKD